MRVPNDRHYTSEHEWIDSAGRVGITDYAQDALGDVVFVELPALGAPLKAGDSFGAVESVKSVSDLYSPVDGTVIAVNEALVEHPEMLNQDPYETGWIVQLSVEGGAGDLLTAEAYRTQIGGEH